MPIRFLIPSDELPPGEEVTTATLPSLAGKKVLFISNQRGRNTLIEGALRQELTDRYGIESLTLVKLQHQTPSPKERLLPLADQYDAVIAGFGG